MKASLEKMVMEASRTYRRVLRRLRDVPEESRDTEWVKQYSTVLMEIIKLDVLSGLEDE